MLRRESLKVRGAFAASVYSTGKASSLHIIMSVGVFIAHILGTPGRELVGSHEYELLTSSHANDQQPWAT